MVIGTTKDRLGFEEGSVGRVPRVLGGRSWDSTGAMQIFVGVRVRKIPDDLRIGLIRVIDMYIWGIMRFILGDSRQGWLGFEC